MLRGEDSRHQSWRGAHILLSWQLPIFPISSNHMERWEQDRMRHLPFFPSILESTQERKQGRLMNGVASVPRFSTVSSTREVIKSTAWRAIYSLQTLVKWILLILAQSTEERIMVPFYRYRNDGSQRLRDLPKDIQLVNARNGDGGPVLSLTPAPWAASPSPRPPSLNLIFCLWVRDLENVWVKIWLSFLQDRDELCLNWGRKNHFPLFSFAQQKVIFGEWIISSWPG